MLFSVIIPTYNRKREILKCLKSIYNQDFPSDKFEIIVVDDASTDGTHKLLLKEDVTILRLKERSGPSVARNFGASKARGKYLAFTDSDCLVPKNWLLSFSDVFRRYPDLFSAGGSYVNLGKSIYCRYESYVYKRYVREEKEYISKERNELPFALGNIAYRKDAFWELGGFNERIPYYCSGEDALLKEKGLKRRKRFLYVPVPILHDNKLTFKSFFRQSMHRGCGVLLYSKLKGRMQSKREITVRLFLSPLHLFYSLVSARFRIDMVYCETLAFIFRNVGKLKFYEDIERLKV